MLDGLDEVPSGARATLSHQIEELSTRAAKCTIILTSRPDVPLPTMTGSRLLTIAPLSEEQSKSLVRRYDAVGNIDVGERLISRFETLPQQFLRTPLLVALLYRSFGYNGEVSSKISSFYDELYSALYKGHDLTKAGFAREKQSALDFDSFRRLLRGFAFLLVAQQRAVLANATTAHEAIEAAGRLTSVSPTSASAFLNDLLLAVPLMVRDGRELRFAHKTIAEYFAAEHLAYAPGGAEIFPDMCHRDHASKFIETVGFVSEISPVMFKNVAAKPIAEAFLAHRPDIENSALRTLSFIAPGACIYVGRDSDHEPGEGLSPPKGAVKTYLKIATADGKRYLLGIAVAHQINPLLPLVNTVLGEEYIPDGCATTAPSRLKDLVRTPWVPVTDPRLWNPAVEPLIDELVAHVLSDLLHSEWTVSERTSYTFNDTRAALLLSELESEEQTRTLLHKLIRPTK